MLNKLPRMRLSLRAPLPNVTVDGIITHWSEPFTGQTTAIGDWEGELSVASSFRLVFFTSRVENGSWTSSGYSFEANGITTSASSGPSILSYYIPACAVIDGLDAYAIITTTYERIQTDCSRGFYSDTHMVKLPTPTLSGSFCSIPVSNLLSAWNEHVAGEYNFNLVPPSGSGNAGDTCTVNFGITLNTIGMVLKMKDRYTKV